MTNKRTFAEETTFEAFTLSVSYKRLYICPVLTIRLMFLQAMEFAFCLDNSGSMGGKKIQHALTALVLLMESLKKLECRFGVMRFGGVGTQVGYDVSRQQICNR